ncbi:hypothetical protein DMTZ50_0489 [Dehalococcoides mccartyi]|nr:hypothetical protein [Dehalococcoides mccartyi]
MHQSEQVNGNHHTMPIDQLGRSGETVVGIDVGGERKGFHAVALLNGHFVDKKATPDPAVIANWCIRHKAKVVAVDAPCRWSLKDSSRLAERELNVAGGKIHCFATPTYKIARANKKGFYDWIFNGEKLYEYLESHRYFRFNGERIKGQICIETFPHAVVCVMAGKVALAKPKARVRREALRSRGYDDSNLPNIDFVDAALCAVAANEFRKDKYQLYGDRNEGFIVVPDLGV